MPIIESKYKAPKILFNGHFQTILASLYNPKVNINYKRERIATHDGDFLDLDWSTVNSSNLAIITHGLEGSTKSTHILRIVQTLNDFGWDCLAWNMRGCSGEPNNHLKTYHSGYTDDLVTVFSHGLFKKKYNEIILIGFSAGGNLTLKFLGEKGSDISGLVRAAVTFSVPSSLQNSAEELSKYKNKIYMNHFLKKLKRKLLLKKSKFNLDLDSFKKIKNFYDYDKEYTAPLFGYNSPEELWNKNSSGIFIPEIKVPTLIINAWDDPILGKKCYPIKECIDSDFVYLETPSTGGHNGFFGNNYFPGKRVIQFINS